jgi:hypothetical protein
MNFALYMLEIGNSEVIFLVVNSKAYIISLQSHYGGLTVTTVMVRLGWTVCQWIHAPVPMMRYGMIPVD